MSPAAGQPGKMPFWHGDRAGRPMEFGRRIGVLMRELREMPRAVAVATLVKDGYLRAVPVDPITKRNDTWVLVREEPDPDHPPVGLEKDMDKFDVEDIPRYIKYPAIVDGGPR